MRVRNILILLAIFLVLGGIFYFSRTPEVPVMSEPKIFVWDIEINEVQHVEIRLPHEGKSEAFIKIREGDKFPWYFDDPQRSEVDSDRWGGGIPLLLTGPAADRIIAEDATEEKLAEFGLTQPQMEVNLTLTDGDTLNIIVGDSAPDGDAFYVQLRSLNDVALVDYTWYQVLERLVKEPPYAIPPAD